MPQLSHTFVLRCWRESADTAVRETAVWRFILENPRTNERHVFATWEAVEGFMEKLMGEELVRHYPEKP